MTFRELYPGLVLPSRIHSRTDALATRPPPAVKTATEDQRLLRLAFLRPFAPSTAAQTAVRRGALAGTVRDTAGEAIAQVRVHVGGDTLRFVLTDPAGAFRLPELAPGPQHVHFRRMGFAPASFAVLIEAGEDSRAQVVLSPATQVLPPIEVRERFNPILERFGFYERRRQGEHGALYGTFLSPEDIADRRPFRTSYLLEAIPGLHMVRSGIDPIKVVPRGRVNCLMAVFLDGFELPPSEVAGGWLDVLANVEHVAAIEVYVSASWMPERFQSMRTIERPCGSIVIWTKSG